MGLSHHAKSKASTILRTKLRVNKTDRLFLEDCHRDAAKAMPVSCHARVRVHVPTSKENHGTDTARPSQDSTGLPHVSIEHITRDTLCEGCRRCVKENPALRLHSAVRWEDADLVREVLASNGNRLINMKDIHGRTPLMLAVLFGSAMEIFKLLCDFGEASRSTLHMNRLGQTALKFGMTQQLFQGEIEDYLADATLRDLLQFYRRRAAARVILSAWKLMMRRRLNMERLLALQEAPQFRIGGMDTHVMRIITGHLENIFMQENTKSDRWAKYHETHPDYVKGTVNCPVL